MTQILQQNGQALINNGGGFQKPTPEVFGNQYSFKLDNTGSGQPPEPDYVEIDDSSSSAYDFIEMGNPLTVSYWIKPNNVYNGYFTVFSKWNVASNRGIALGLIWQGGISSHLAFLDIRDGGNSTRGQSHPTSAPTVPLSQWTHVVTRWSGSQYGMSFFINGQGPVDLSGFVGALPATVSVADKPLIGRRPDNSIYDAMGWIDEVTIWDKWLDNTDAALLYGADGVVADVSTIDDYATNCKGWFRMGDDANYDDTYSGEWEFIDQTGNCDARSYSTEEINRTTDIPTPS